MGSATRQPAPRYPLQPSSRRGRVRGHLLLVPEWTEDCVEDAGIPLWPEKETITVRQGEAAHLVFALRASEGKYVEGNPVLESAVAYPLGQEGRRCRPR